MSPQAMSCSALMCSCTFQPRAWIRWLRAGQESKETTALAGFHMLPVHGIRLEEIPRAARNGEVISASRVRRLLMEHGVTREVLDLVPPCTQAYLKENWERLNAKKGDVG